MHVETSTSISTPSSWKAFKTMLEREFRPKDTWYTTRTKMETLKQTGSVPEYANEFRSLLLQIEHNLPEEEVVFQFIFRLKENIRKCVRDTNPETLEEAVQAAERYDNIYHEPQGASDFLGRNHFVSNRPNFGRANFNRANGGRSTPRMTRPTPMDLDIVRSNGPVPPGDARIVSTVERKVISPANVANLASTSIGRI